MPSSKNQKHSAESQARRAANQQSWSHMPNTPPSLNPAFVPPPPVFGTLNPSHGPEFVPYPRQAPPPNPLYHAYRSVPSANGGGGHAQGERHGHGNTRRQHPGVAPPVLAPAPPSSPTADSWSDEGTPYAYMTPTPPGIAPPRFTAALDAQGRPIADGRGMYPRAAGHQQRSFSASKGRPLTPFREERRNAEPELVRATASQDVLPETTGLMRKTGPDSRSTWRKR